MEETTTQIVGMSQEQITEASTALTGAVETVLDTFVDMLPIIALTTGAIFAVKFIKGRFRKVDKI